MKQILAILLIGFLLLSVAMVSGCVGADQDRPKSTEEAQKAVVDVSKDVEKSSEILGEIDKKLG